MDPSTAQTYMQPEWFFPLFAVMWLAISGSLSGIGGWFSLARTLRALEPASGRRFRFVSGSMGAKIFPVSYGGCLFVTINSKGFGLALLFPFRFLSPPLFIPWSQVESVETRKFLFVDRTVVGIRDQWPLVSIRGAAGRCLDETYRAVRSGRAI